MVHDCDETNPGENENREQENRTIQYSQQTEQRRSVHSSSAERCSTFCAPLNYYSGSDSPALMLAVSLRTRDPMCVHTCSAHIGMSAALRSRFNLASDRERCSAKWKDTRSGRSERCRTRTMGGQVQVALKQIITWMNQILTTSACPTCCVGLVYK